MERLPIIILDGLVFASYLFLVSAGLTFIYGVMRILNTAHGSLYGLGAYAGASLVAYIWGGRSGLSGLPPVLSYLVLLIGAIIVGVIVGPIIERVFLQRVANRGEIVPLILTFAIFLMFEDIMKLIWGVNPLLVSLPSDILGAVRLAGVSYEAYKIVQLGVAIVAAIVLWFIVNRTTFGKLIISVIADREVSAAMGINVPRVFTGAFIIGAAMAAIGGAFISPTLSVVPGIAVEAIILAFAVTTIGGLGSVPGAAIGSLLVGILRAAAVHTIPELDLFVVYALMTLILLIKPQGLFGGVEARRI